MLSDSLDANIIIHGIVGDPASWREKIWHFLDDSDSQHRVEDIAISETIYVLDKYYDQTRVEIAKNLTLFFCQFDDKLNYNRTIMKMILPFWVEHPSLSFNDCYLGFRAELDNAEQLFTLDKKLASQHPSAKLI